MKLRNVDESAAQDLNHRAIRLRPVEVVQAINVPAAGAANLGPRSFSQPQVDLGNHSALSLDAVGEFRF